MLEPKYEFYYRTNSFVYVCRKLGLLSLQTETEVWVKLRMKYLF